VSVAWSASCAGSFSAETGAASTFTPAGVPADHVCALTATASDGRGGAGAGTVRIWVAPPDPAAGSATTFLVRALQLGTSASDDATAVAVDASGNALVVGSTTGALDGSASDGGTDAFVASLDPIGERLWLVQLADASGAFDLPTAVAADASGSALVGGITQGAPYGCARLGGNDGFVTKLAASGAHAWTTAVGTAAHDMIVALAATPAGEVVVAGLTEGAFPGQASAGGWDVFVAKLDAAGAVQWIRQLGTAEDDSAKGVATDASGNVYVVGYTGGSLDGVTPATGQAAFLVALDAAGATVFARQLALPAPAMATAVAVGGAGALYVGGSAGGQAFLGAYDASGAERWVRTFGAAGDEATTVAADAAGHVYVAGATTGVVEGALGDGEDAFVLEYDASGARVWGAQVGGSEGRGERPAGSALSSTGTLWIAGSTSSDLLGNASAGESDAFVLRYRRR
jgi:hypothetical protein